MLPVWDRFWGGQCPSVLQRNRELLLGHTTKRALEWPVNLVFTLQIKRLSHRRAGVMDADHIVNTRIFTALYKRINPDAAFKIFEANHELNWTKAITKPKSAQMQSWLTQLLTLATWKKQAWLFLGFFLGE